MTNGQKLILIRKTNMSNYKVRCVGGAADGKKFNRNYGPVRFNYEYEADGLRKFERYDLYRKKEGELIWLAFWDDKGLVESEM